MEPKSGNNVTDISKKIKSLNAKAREIQRRIAKAPAVGSFFYEYRQRNKLNLKRGVAVAIDSIKAVLTKRPFSVFSNPNQLSVDELKRVYQLNASLHFPLQPEVVWRILEIEHELKREAELRRRATATVLPRDINETLPGYNPGGQNTPFSNVRVSTK